MKDTIVRLLNQIDVQESLGSHYDFKSHDLICEVDGYTLKAMEVEGGYSGAGEDYHIVFSVCKPGETEPSSYWQIPGYYASQSGSELEIDRVFEVEPEQRMVTFWEPVSKKSKKK